MRHPLQCIAQAVGEIIHRVDAPGVSGSVVGNLADPVEGRVTHMDVGRRHIDLCPKHMASIFEFPITHTLEKVQILFNGSIPEGTVASRFGQGASIFPNLLCAQAVDISLSPADENTGEFIELLEIIGCVGQPVSPVKPKPTDILQNRLGIGRILLDRVGVIKTHEAMAAIVPWHSKIEENRLGMPDVEKPVRLRRKTGHHLLMLAGF